MYYAGKYDVIVVGAGHAGCEAALAAARLGCKTLVITLNLDSIALMPCNPSIGGTAKGHLVREIDALGGQMGINIDKTYIQSRMLNTSKGPAVHSLRAQADKKKYQALMKKTLEEQENLYLKQDEVVAIDVENGRIKGVKTKNGAYFECKALVITTGTYLRARIFIGEVNYSGGPNGLFPANELSKSLEEHGIVLRRFKTGTPARIHKRSVDFSKMIIQPGDEKVVPFSFMSDDITREQIPCYLTYTTEKTHEIIRQNIHRSPLFSGLIEGVGPRYCPSIEDKVMKFPDKEKHQVFIEPEGEDTDELYVQGMSSSLPEDVQIQVYRSIPGLENCEILRTAYAIEYDCIDPTQLKLSLELKTIEGLFFAGQVNGSSGYEEAAAQGIIAGINAAHKVKGKEPFILDRSEAYIGVLIDDLVTKGTNEPYRMMTSRAEYRLLLRQDNADLRLTQKGYDIGLVTEERYQRYLKRKENIEKEIERLKKTVISPSERNNEILRSIGSSEIRSGITLYELIKRPEVTYENIKDLDTERPDLPKDVTEEVEIEIKYEGYIKKQIEQVEQFKKLESKKIPQDINYEEIQGLRLEARQKLSKIRPENIGQASRISGVSPADISVLLVYLEQLRRKKVKENE
ncbi:tRNA uridine 5-carboxymethylaminomethyl modification enzyme [Caloramator fervidus]|uniref:tRNA uridine 5-carboxymethylaminomethyl modification enzyme MnmG n=1 Tax=Caloramator fervidus TaxID=29344 RepID=A0A1H5WFF7_9CLOT|nr:tRNA uridine-5-carboxymethylaminomethyl(34) synthesis enzyme MnmG [Caloramator fervidus]SEF98204.1 tRNA uridine 5-carboxymethylaminomethyl modification enzyme [Caloramator fervidus]